MSFHTRKVFCAGLAFLAAALSPVVSAQIALSTAQLVPATPTSADTVYLRLSRPCGASQFATPPYAVRLSASRIDVDVRYLPGAPRIARGPTR